MRHTSFSAAGALAAAIFAVGAWSVSLPAQAQRALTNTNSGNDPPLPIRSTTALVNCNVLNTARLGIGRADACLGQLPSGESVASVGQLLDNFNMSSGLAYTLALTGGGPDRAIAGGGGISSGGLFRGIGLGSDNVNLEFLRVETGSYAFAFSGLYRNSGTNNQWLEWSSYYLFDDVMTDLAIPVPAGLIGTMPFRPFQLESFLLFDPATGTLNERLRWVLTEGLVVNQVSVYGLRTDVRTVPVSAPASWTLVLLALVAVGLAARRRPREPS